MNVIYKYEAKAKNISGQGEFVLTIPAVFKFLSAQDQGGSICLWYLVDPDIKTLVEKRFRIIATGQDFEYTDRMKYLATVQQPPFVWHLFEIK